MVVECKKLIDAGIVGRYLYSREAHLENERKVGDEDDL